VGIRERRSFPLHSKKGKKRKSLPKKKRVSSEDQGGESDIHDEGGSREKEMS